ncbi:hypothetical protein [Aminobacter carboxidus]|jgi:hypothetical protein|nr:hypothetical protein [Aminobacter lissarensis]
MMSNTGHILPEQKMPKLIVVAAFMLCWRVTGIYTLDGRRRLAALFPVAAAMSVANTGWALLFWIW